MSVLKNYVIFLFLPRLVFYQQASLWRYIFLNIKARLGTIDILKSPRFQCLFCPRFYNYVFILIQQQLNIIS